MAVGDDLQEWPCLIRQLPQEILLEIFSFCFPPAEDSDIVDCGALPLVLTYVSRLWRQLVCGCSRLWVTLTIRPPGSAVANWQKGLFFLQLWLDRSRGRPVDISLLVPAHRDCNATVMDPIFSMLMEHAHQWRSFVTTLPLHKLQRLQQVTYPTFAALKHFELQQPTAFHSQRSINAYRLFSFLEHAPNLEHFSIRSQFAMFGPLPKGIHWLNLRTLHLQCAFGRFFSDVPSIVNILMIMPLLERFYMRMTGVQPLATLKLTDAGGGADKDIVLAFLKSFTFIFEAPTEKFPVDTLEQLTHRLVLPALEQLDISYLEHCEYTWSAIPSISDMLRSGSQLKSLALNGVNLGSGREMRECLALVSDTLERFAVLASGCTGLGTIGVGMLESLIIKADSGLCPRLKSLSLDYDGDDGEGEVADTLLRVLKSRVGTLKSASLKRADRLVLDLDLPEDELGELKRAGMAVDWD